MPKPSKALTQLWRDKLEKSGFVDIEDEREDRLKTWDSYWFITRGSPQQFYSKMEYYQRASELLNVQHFVDETEIKVWTLHANGRSLREISKEAKVPMRAVRKIITKLKKVILGNTD